MKESQCVEWKESLNDECLKLICGFANSQGGKLILGLKDDGSVCGVESAEKLLEDIPNKVQDIFGIIVNVNLLNKDNKNILEVIVSSSSSPIHYRGEYYYRRGSSNKLLKGNQIVELSLFKNGFYFDSQIDSQYNVENLDKESFDIFRKQALIHKRMDSEELNCSNRELLEHLQLLTSDGQLTRAAIMTFYSNPEELSFGCYTKIGCFEGSEVLYQDEVHGSLLVQAERVIDLLNTKYFKALVSYDPLTKIEKYPYPIEAIREAVYNALIHNNYHSGIPIQIKVYKDRIYIWNDVNYFYCWPIDEIPGRYQSMQSNPSIANVFKCCGLVEAKGRGIEKIYQACGKSGNSYPMFDISGCGIMVKFDA